MGIFSVFSKDKSFALPVIGSVRLNQLGLHLFRIRLADVFLTLRRFQVTGPFRPQEYKQFKQDGILALENFLPDDEYQKLLNEVQHTITTADQHTPIQSYGEEGFGDKHKHAWGFDRYDGGTLNRFYNITAEQPSTQAFIHNKRLKKITKALAGSYHDCSKYFLYKLFHGKEEQNADIQKAIHRDTFHSAIKLWYFLEDVEPKHGPFHYAPGTHKMTRERLQWEKQRSIKASSENKGGAFRIEKDELDALSEEPLKAYPVKANTLVIADIRGFHCRGQALENQARLSIYANIRPSPYLPALPLALTKRIAGLFK